jgi:hypothetical protein
VVNCCVFQANPVESLIIVGGARDLDLQSRKSSAGLLFAFRITQTDDGLGLELVHKVIPFLELFKHFADELRLKLMKCQQPFVLSKDDF